MSDRELLEKAAKALGWLVTGYSERRSTGVVDGGMALVLADGRAFGWSPLHHDGDALRLVVALQLDLSFFPGFKEIKVEPASVHLTGHAEEPYAEDMNAATRRAIVRAAAALAKASA